MQKLWEESENLALFKYFNEPVGSTINIGVTHCNFCVILNGIKLNCLTCSITVSFTAKFLIVTFYKMVNNKDVNNQKDATNFSFINLFNSALHVSADSTPQHSTAVSRRPCCAVALSRTVWSEHGMASVNHTRPHCVNQMGKTHSKPLAPRHGMGTACYVWIGL